MEFFDVIKARRSCRRFTSEKVPADVINKALDAAIIAPNSSNMQTWEFYWVRSEEKKAKLVTACLGQPAASTAQELIVAVSNHGNWNRNRKLIIEDLKANPKIPKAAYIYYEKLMPFTYTYGPLNSFGWIKKIIANVGGLFRAVPRKPNLRSELFEMMTKSTALACENFMLAIYAQGYACCPMEGHDEWRVKNILGLGCQTNVCMVIGIGKADEKGIWGPQFRIPRNLVVKEI